MCWGRAWGHPLLGALSALLLLGVHLFLSQARSAEGLRLLGACVIGMTIDSLQQGLNVFTFKTDPAWPFWLPLWVPVIWAQFASLFRYALYWLSGRYLLAAIFGLFGGPLAYWGGVKLGAASFGNNPLVSIASLAIVWALATPTLFWLSDQLPDREGEYRWFRSK